MNEQPLSRLHRGSMAHTIGGVLIFGWRSAPAAQVLWPANNDSTLGQAPQKVINACVGFEIEGAHQLRMSWNHPVLFDVSQDCFDAFLLARRKAFVDAAAHTTDRK